MPQLIKGSLTEGGRVADDVWTAVDTEDSLREAPVDAPLLVVLPLWQAQRDALVARGVLLGVRLEPVDDPAVLADDLRLFTLVAITFPKFTDGRGYSIARLLRERYAYRGEIRAVGEVLRDQIFYMLRSGFDSFALKDGASIDDALSAYADFSEAYQTSVERTLPLFRRRVVEHCLSAAAVEPGSA